MAKETKGSCLCGKVQYEITGSLGVFQYCHCSRCQKFTGSAFAASIIVSPNQFRWIRGEHLLGRHEVADAKHFATSFCQKCGSSLPWKSKSKNAVVVPAGSLDGDPEIRPFQNVYYQSKADWYSDAGELIKFDTLPKFKVS